MPVVRAAEAVIHELHGTRFTSFAAPATGSAELCAWRVDVPAGTTGLPHGVTREEVFLVTAGRLRITLDGQSSTVEVGDAVVVPAGSSLRLDNPGAETASAWVSTSVGLEAVLADGSRLTPPWVR